MTGWKTVLFPYRSHLEEEIVYLRGQMAQRDRRLQVLEDALTEITRPQPKAPKEAPQTAVFSQRGWDGYRTKRKIHGREEDVSARPDARGQSSPDDYRPEGHEASLPHAG
jgi:hypothetical protein